MRTKLITALRITAKAIADGRFAYLWKEPQGCNCGALACALTGKSKEEMRTALLDTQRAGPKWREKVGALCPMTGTGMPEHEVLAAMYNAGMTAQDIIELECLSNPEVLKRVTLEPARKKTSIVGRLWWKRQVTADGLRGYEIPQNAVAYMRAWADLLEEQDRQDIPETESTETISGAIREDPPRSNEPAQTVAPDGSRVR